MCNKSKKFTEALRLDIAYDGRAYHGFQTQLDGSGIQDIIEKSLTIVMRRQIKLKTASRTDSGVHAEGQVAVMSYSPEYDIPLAKIYAGVNALLPDDIGVIKLTAVNANFDPCRKALAKVYRYRLWQGHCHNPFIRPYVCPIYPRLDENFLLLQLKQIVGRHDFKAFCNKDSDMATTIRKIFDIQLRSNGNYIELWFLGEGFLKQQIRIIVGTIVDLAHNKLKLSIDKIIASRQREQAGRTAPARGLTLVEIFYDHIPQLSTYLPKEVGFSWWVR